MSQQGGEGLTHLDARGRTRMVDVGDRPVTERSATAAGMVTISERAYQAVALDRVTKGQPLEVARLAGIMAAKRTPELIPLCHPLALSNVVIEATLEEDPFRVELQATVSSRGNTGVEMEALTAVAVAGLTLIDMLKSLDPWAEIGGIRLLHKKGGRSGEVVRPGAPRP